MEEWYLMKDHRRRRLVLLIAVFMILIIYLGSEYASIPTYFDEVSYIDQYLLPTASRQRDSPMNNVTKPSTEVAVSVETSLEELIKKADIAVTVVTEDHNEKIVEVTYADSHEDRYKKSLFMEFKDIAKSSFNIFFIESRCSTEKMAKYFNESSGFVLNARQSCAIESTALTNLDREVYIFHSCPLGDDFLDHSPEFVERLLSYPNVHLVRLNTSEALLGTPVEELHRKGLLETSSYPVEHTSDVLRLALLWRFGGTYCDLDVITIRSLNPLRNNWAGMQDTDTIANGVLNFEHEGVGHEMLRQALDHINLHYDATGWGTNGPSLITAIVLKECNVSSVTEAMRTCQETFSVLPTIILYPLYYNLAGQFFDESIGKDIVNRVKGSAYSVHFWNKMSHEMEGRVGSTQAYALLADEFCPEVYHNCGSKF